MGKLKSCIWLLFLCFVLIFPAQSQAIAKFNTSYKIHYQVDSTGKTKVQFVINQKNNLSVVYATDFGISINETKIENVKVYDEGVLIIPDVNKTQNQTSISFPFANKVVGKDKEHNFSIEYETTDVASKFGNTWQINIPRLEPDENVSEQTVILTVPAGFSNPAYIDPKPDLINGNIFYFSGNKISNKPISAIFGKSQYYRGELIYHLVGSKLESTVREIALPPDTSYQTVYFQNLDPKPENIRLDNDGNFLATYTVKPDVELKVILDMYVKIDINPKPSIVPPASSLLNPNSIWNYDHSVFSWPEIRNLKTPKAIFDFVSDKLTYDYEKINRDKPVRSPAAESLINHNSAICTDFTDVFVAIARKKGIHAREIQGFAVSENPDLKPISLTRDVLHAWPEYFDSSKNTWVQVDPTWTNTTRGIDYFNKLDFNHIALAIHGETHDYPVPAGGYKNGNQSKDVRFEPVDFIEFPKPTFDIQYFSQENSWIVFKINNTSGVSYYGKVENEGGEFLEKTEKWLHVAPFSAEEYRIKIKNSPILGKSNTQAIIYLNGERFESGVSIASSSNKIILFTGIGGVLALSAFGARHLYLRRRKQKTPIHW